MLHLPAIYFNRNIPLLQEKIVPYTKFFLSDVFWRFRYKQKFNDLALSCYFAAPIDRINALSSVDYCVLLGLSGSRFAIQDLSGSCCMIGTGPWWIRRRFLRCTMIQTDLGSLILIQITPKERTLIFVLRNITNLY